MDEVTNRSRREWLLGSALLAAGCSGPEAPDTDADGSGQSAASPRDQMLLYARGLEQTQMVHVAAELGLADLMADGGQPTEELARATKTHTPSLYRLLRALTSLGLFAQLRPNVFSLTEAGQFLRSDHPDGLRDLILWNGSGWRLRAWAELGHSIRTGETAMREAHGTGLYEYLESHPEDAEVFNAIMTRSTRRIASALADAYDFSDVETVADLGGGEGLLLATILKSAPALKGIVFELPNTASAAQEFLESESLAGRGRAMGGDFFESVPPADIYILMRVLQDWSDREAVQILANCRKQIRPGGRVLIIEKVVPAEASSPEYPLTDIHKMVQTGTAERTRDQFQLLLERSGFKLSRVIPLEADLGDGYPPSIIEGAIA